LLAVSVPVVEGVALADGVADVEVVGDAVGEWEPLLDTDGLAVVDWLSELETEAVAVRVLLAESDSDDDVV
jgi:hypothetical protein